MIASYLASRMPVQDASIKGSDRACAKIDR